MSYDLHKLEYEPYKYITLDQKGIHGTHELQFIMLWSII